MEEKIIDNINLTSNAIKYISNHKDEAKIYQDVIKQIYNYFTNIKEIIVDTVIDDDINGIYSVNLFKDTTLAIDIVTACSVQHAMEQLSLFDDKWWLDYTNTIEEKSHICVDVISVED